MPTFMTTSPTIKRMGSSDHPQVSAICSYKRRLGQQDVVVILRRMLLGAMLVVAGCTRVGQPAQAPTSQKATAWAYGINKDQMRGSIAHYAYVDSTTPFELRPPYVGADGAHLMIDQGGNAQLVLDKGQLTCGHVSAKFDNGAIWSFPCETNDNNSVAKLEDAGRSEAGHDGSFSDLLRRSKHLVLEADVFDNGKRQLEFTTASLDPKRMGWGS